MSDLSIEADDLFPDDFFDDMTRKPAKKQQINLGSIFGIRPRSPSAPRKTVVRLRLLLVADDKHWPRESMTDVRKILRGRRASSPHAYTNLDTQPSGLQLQKRSLMRTRTSPLN